jgi:hypothetical protein
MGKAPGAPRERGRAHPPRPGDVWIPVLLTTLLVLAGAAVVVWLLSLTGWIARVVIAL